MKLYLLIVFVGVYLTVAQAGFTPEQLQKLDKAHKACGPATKVDMSLVEQARKGQFADDAALKEYTTCVSKALNFVDANGKIQKEVIVKKVGGVIGDDKLAAKIGDECIVAKESSKDDVYKMVKCVYEKTPDHVSIL